MFSSLPYCLSRRAADFAARRFFMIFLHSTASRVFTQTGCWMLDRMAAATLKRQILEREKIAKLFRGNPSRVFPIGGAATGNESSVSQVFRQAPRQRKEPGHYSGLYQQHFVFGRDTTPNGFRLTDPGFSSCHQCWGQGAKRSFARNPTLSSFQSCLMRANSRIFPDRNYTI